ncbi:biotin synthase BioB, partial [Halorubrum pallidum]
VGTHDFEDRVKTLEVAKEAGMDLCAGVILGMGESPTDRVDAAIALQDLSVSSLPVNILNPVAGTMFDDREEALISTTETVKTIAVYRLLHPHARVRLTGGREVNFAEDEQHLPFEAGADGILTGNYLTTEGQSPGDDIEMIEQAGMEPNTEVNDFDPEEVKSRGDDSADPADTAVGTATSKAEPSDD